MWDAFKQAAFWFVDVYRILWALGLGCLFAWIFWIHPKLAAAKQVHNWATMQPYVSFLSSYHDAHGNYPLTLEEAIPALVANRERYLLARDGYDHPLHYRSDGQQFLLASYGADGVADRDPLALNDPEIASPTWACNDDDRDTKYSSNGSVQLCGK
jgi:hypothetical protein